MSKTKNFIVKAVVKHGDRYDYSLVNYVHCHTKVSITCRNHGEFTQSPNNHLNGKGCPKCAHNKVNLHNTISHNDFISRVNTIHKNKFDYSKCKYTKGSKRIKIICPKHGEFTQLASQHLHGRGCKLYRLDAGRGW